MQYLYGLFQNIKHFDVILIDTPPDINATHILTLSVSTHLIITTPLDYLALDGVSNILSVVTSLQDIPNVTLPKILGVLPVLYEKHSKNTRQNLGQLLRMVGSDNVLPPIPKDTKIKEASARGLSIWEYAPRCNAAVGYDLPSPIKNSQGKVGGFLHLGEIVMKLLEKK
jgi:chromosome partitioning protein